MAAAAALTTGALLTHPLTTNAAISATDKFVWDDFTSGFKVGNFGGSTNKWFYEHVANYVGNDGIRSTSENGLNVVSSGSLYRKAYVYKHGESK